MWPEVEELEGAMQALLTLLEDPLAPGLEVSWERCRKAEARLVERMNTSPALPPEQQDDLRAGLDRLVRLNAVARQSLLRGQEQLSGRLKATREKGAQMRAYSKGPAATGGSRDLSG